MFLKWVSGEILNVIDNEFWVFLEFYLFLWLLLGMFF